MTKHRKIRNPFLGGSIQFGPDGKFYSIMIEDEDPILIQEPQLARAVVTLNTDMAEDLGKALLDWASKQP